ncbi:MAG: Stf0 family sulfotransferase [Cyanobacteria bacterium J06621_11]
MYSAIPVGAHEKKTHQFFSQKQSSSAQATAQTLSAQSPSAPPTSKESPATASTLFVCFTNRCGSTLLTSKLSQFGLAGRAEKFKNYEHFNHKVISTYCNEKKINSLFDYSRSIAEAFSGPLGYFTSKVSSDQLFWLGKTGVFGKVFQSPTFINVKRKNVVKQAISLVIAKQSGKWTSLHPGTKSDKALVFDEADILKNMLQIHRSNALIDLFFSLHSITPITVYYEEIAENESYLTSLLEAELNCTLTATYENTLPVKKQATNLNTEWENRFREMYQLSR